jgi:hypothetical protein
MRSAFSPVDASKSCLACLSAKIDTRRAPIALCPVPHEQQRRALQGIDPTRISICHGRSVRSYNMRDNRTDLRHCLLTSGASRIMALATIAVYELNLPEREGKASFTNRNWCKRTVAREAVQPRRFPAEVVLVYALQTARA